MGLKDRILEDIKEAMKSKETDRLNTLRFLNSAIKNREIELRPNLINDEEIYGVIKKLAKQRKDSIDQFQQAGRQDLADKEALELKFMEVYLPQQLSAEELRKVVEQAVAQVGATTVKDMGKVMQAVMAQTKGAADNKTVSEIVRARLGN
jgi:uncharacterized protein YqeY